MSAIALLLLQMAGAGAGPAVRPEPLPGVRNGHALFYDAVRREVILFGGADHTRVRGDTWSWQGSSWRLLTEVGPSPRTFPASASDPDSGTGFLFGGNRVLFGTDASRDTFLADLWTWQDTRWTRQPSAGPAPAARAEAAMTYDTRRRRLVLFGGYSRTNGVTTRFGDTWEWDGRRWSRASDRGPTPRNGAAMAYDPVRGVSVLFGGSDGAASGETWEWDGADWTRSDVPLADPRFNTVMWYDPATKRLMRFGGWYDGRRWGDTWEGDGTRWTRMLASGPAPRNHAAVAYDLGRQRAVLVGGHDGDHVFGDVWEWQRGRWREVARAAPMLRADNGH